MNIKQLLSDDEGVSPVIGVILMVAITVILAAVIAAFVLGLGDSDDVAPQTSFEFDFDPDTESAGDTELTITVTSGDTIDESQLTVEVGGDEQSVWDGNEEVSAGASVTLNANDDDLDQGEPVNVVWDSEDGDDSSILASFDLPDDNSIEW